MRQNKQTTNRRSGKRPTKKFEKEVEVKDVSKVRGGDNDISWYNRAQQLVLDAANLSYSSILGTPMEKDPIFGDEQTEVAIPSIPGVMQFNWSPSVGISLDSTSAINVASKRLYTFVRHANSGHSNYDSPDLMLYILAMDSLYALHSMGLRAYGIARYYQMLNRYAPETILNAAGFDVSIQYNLADFRMFLNTVSLKISSMAVPAEFDLFKRHVWLNSGVYKDSPGEKAQMYVFTSQDFWKFAPTTETTGGKLAVVTREVDNEPYLNLERYIKLFNELGEPIFGDEDMNIMSGDILKAYGNDAVIRVGTIDEGYFVQPEFNMEVLSQIQNLNICNLNMFATGLGAGEVQQANNILLFNPQLTRPDTKGNEEYKLFTVSADRPTPEQTMIASRLAFFTQYNLDPELGGVTTFLALGTEWIRSARVYTKGNKWDGTKYTFGDITYFINDTKVLVDIPSVGSDPIIEQMVTGFNKKLLDILSITKFQMHPIIEVYSKNFVATYSEDQAFWFRDYLGDVDTYTQVTSSTLRKMHDTALLSVLHVDGIYRR